MKITFHHCLAILFLSLGVLSGLSSCKKSNPKTYLSKVDQKLIDSLDQVYKDQFQIVFFDSIPVYEDTTEKKILDQLRLGDKVYFDTLLGPFVDMETIHKTTFKYVKSGKVKQGVTHQEYFAKQVTRLKQDTTILLIANYLPPKGDFCAVEIKATRGNQVLTSFIPDDSVNTGFWLDLYIMDSVSLKDAGDVVFLSSYYPACGYGTDNWYFSFKNNKFTTLSHTQSWADAPYWMNTNVYLPHKTNKGMVMAMWSSNWIVRDTNDQIVTYSLSEEYLKDINQMIYQESHRSYEVVDKNGNPVLDEYEESKLGDELYEKRWFKWNGTAIQEVKVDTTIVQVPD